MTHTPGNWFYDERTESIAFAGGWLGSTKGRRGEGLGDRHADGRLMAAAPALLAELERVRDDLAMLAGAGIRLVACKRVDTLIAKVRGEGAR